MKSYLLCATPIHGHAAPMIEIGRHLAGRGHRVTLLSGSRFRAAAVQAGLSFLPLHGKADFDDRQPAQYLPDRAQFKGIARAQYDIQTIFIQTIPEQFRAVQAALLQTKPDAVLVDAAFAGALPLLNGPCAARPPILAAGVVPLSQSSRDLAPYGMGLPPDASWSGRLRNRVLSFAVRRLLFRRTQVLANRCLAELGCPPSRTWVMDADRR